MLDGDGIKYQEKDSEMPRSIFTDNLLLECDVCRSAG